MSVGVCAQRFSAIVVSSVWAKYQHSHNSYSNHHNNKGYYENRRR